MNRLPSKTAAARRVALALGLWTFCLGGAEANPSFLRTDTSDAVPAQDVEFVLSQSGLLATLAPGDRIVVYDAAMDARADSKVFLALSSEYLAAACLTGLVSVDGETAGPGEVILWNFATARPEVSTFDVQRFLATSPLAADPVIRAELESVAESQRSQVFWGLLQVERRNVRAPVAPSVEAVRRAYLLEPAVVEVRREAGGDQDKLARLVAEHFLVSLTEKKVEPVEALMSPLLFQADERALSRESWQALRGRFAKTLVDGGLPDKLAGFQIRDAAGTDAVVVGAQDSLYRLDLVEIDGMLFVEGLERQEEAKTLN